jgi:formyl-CoA transferase
MRSGGVTGIHPTKDGHLYISANTPHFWRALCELTGLTDLASDPAYDSVRKRARHADEIVPKLRAALETRTAVQWERIFGDRVPCGAVRTIEDMFDHPQVLDQSLVAKFQHKTAGRYRGLGRPLKFSGSPGPEPFAAPALGEHTAEALARFGYSADEIDSLRKLKVIPD